MTKKKGVGALSYLLLLMAAAPRMWAVFYDQGIFWPDEIYQSLEQGHRFAFGYGITPWEFREGARSWVFPGIVGIVMKVGGWLGMSTGVGVVCWTKTFMVSLALVAVWAAMRLAQRRAGLPGALLAGAMIAGFPSMIVYGARCMTEMASGPAILVAALLLDERRNARRAFAGGAVASLAIYLRYQNGLVAVGLLLLLLFNRRWMDALYYSLAATVVGIAGGMLDWITWGKPFSAFIYYVKFNVIEGKAAAWGVDPFGYYAHQLWWSTGWASWVVCIGLVLAVFRARMLLLICAAYFVAHSYVPHKELRFIMPIVPLALTVSAIGLGTALSWIRWRSWRFDGHAWPSWVLALPLCGVLMNEARSETFEKMGYVLGPTKGHSSPWHSEEDANFILWGASVKKDVCGMILTGANPIATGGFSYFHHDVPLFFWGSGALRMANYYGGVGAQPPGPEWRLIYTHGAMSLFRRDGGCDLAPPSAYDRKFR
jgi:GPI mannosyltransferase 3